MNLVISFFKNPRDSNRRKKSKESSELSHCWMKTWQPNNDNDTKVARDNNDDDDNRYLSDIN